MKPQFTPGPWHVANGVQVRSTRDQIAKVWMMRNGEGKRNAALIAAAPALYGALAAIVNDPDSWLVLRVADMERAEAALALAEDGE